MYLVVDEMRESTYSAHMKYFGCCSLVSIELQCMVVAFNSDSLIGRGIVRFPQYVTENALDTFPVNTKSINVFMRSMRQKLGEN